MAITRPISNLAQEGVIVYKCLTPFVALSTLGALYKMLSTYHEDILNMPVKVVPKVEIEDEEEDLFEGMTPTNTEEIEKEVAKKLPPFPAKTIRASKANIFWDWVEAVDESEFDHLVPYLYRTRPIIDRQRVDSKAAINIDKLGEKRTLNLDYIKRTHGSGGYKITVNDVNKAINGRGGTIGEVYIEIDEPGLEPILRLDELDYTHRDNKVYVDKLIAQGKITPDGKVTQVTPIQNNGNDPALMGMVKDMMGEFMKRSNQPPPKDTSTEVVGGMYSKAFDAAVGMIKDNARTESDPFKMLTALKELLPQQDSGAGMLAMVLKLQGDSQAREQTMMLKLMEVMQAKQETESDIDKLLKFKELGLLGGGEGGSSHKRSTLEILAEAGAPILGKVFDTVQLILQGNMLAKAGLVPPNPSQPQQPPPQPAPQITKGENIVEMPTPQETDQFTQLLTQYGGMIVQAINTKTPGDAFAESIETLFSPVVYQSIAGLGKEEIIKRLQSVPLVWNQIGGAPQLVNQFIDEFIAYGSQEEEGEEG